MPSPNTPEVPSLSDLMTQLGFDTHTQGEGEPITVRSPRDGAVLAQVASHSPAQLAQAVDAASQAARAWRRVPGPVRGELVRRLGDHLRAHKDALGALVTLEAGKIRSEGLGEVQEMIDICDFATGLSRQLYGLTMASERPGHRMMETWHPVGVVGVISAFNFPVAVWAWNAALALVCGNAVVWKPSEKTPLTALACSAILKRVWLDFQRDHSQYLSTEDALALTPTVIGGRDLGEGLAASPAVAVLSATGSTRMGRAVAQTVAQRLGRSILELGGNNAMIITPSADLSLAERAITFSAVGTAGQRCTTLRRVIVHRSVADALQARLAAIFDRVQVGDPFAANTLVGPLVDAAASQAMQNALARAQAEGGQVLGGQAVAVPGLEGGAYHRPALVIMPTQSAVVREETFAPILYLLRYDTLDEAIALQNAVPQGLSSAIFTNDVREAETFLSADGSDCGIANVNIGTSGAEIGGAFGGEKDTGGGRESGSDAWKAYMRRATNTINYSRALPLAQGVQFEV